MIWHLILGGLAGFLAGKVMRGAGFGIIMDIIVGIVGGWLGGWLGAVLHIPTFSYFITAFLGAIILVWLVRLLR